jgi:hypothetical protein
MNNKWDKAVHPLSWLLEKFAPVPDWTPVEPERSWGVVYYTDNNLDPEIMLKCQRQLKRSIGNHPLVSVSLKPIDFGDNICMDLEAGPIAMFKQILAGVERLKTDLSSSLSTMFFTTPLTLSFFQQ